MKIQHYTEIPATDVEEASGVKRRWLIGEEDGAPNFAMRMFEVEPGGYTPHHSHNWEHEVFVLEGKGVVRSEQKENPVRQGSVVFILPNEPHQLVNTSKETLKFLCLIPIGSGAPM